MSKKKRGLNKREKLFCAYFVNSADIEHAAKRAGYSEEPLLKGQSLLLKKEVADEIEALSKVRSRAMCDVARLQYEKLIFGNIEDAVSLLFMESPTKKQLKKMNLYMVQEIKKLKDGAMEIKFFDRLKALERIALKDDKENEKNSFTTLEDALSLGAQNLTNCAGDSDEL